MHTSTGSRPSTDQYFMTLTRHTASRATCCRRQVGCILVDVHGHVLATGYNGVHAGAVHCTDVPCPGANQPSGQGLHLCQAIHAEQNALLQCKDSMAIHTVYVSTSPCVQCMRLIANTSVKRIVFAEAYPHVESFLIAESRSIVWELFRPNQSSVAPLPEIPWP